MYQIELEQFQGPLDLLLQLIEEQKLEITEVSLVKVTEQYVNFLNRSETLAPEELADFLLVAAKLLYLKSKALLPALQLHDEEMETDDLATQLRIYKEYLEASKKIEQLIARKSFAFAREKMPVSQENSFSPPKTLSVVKMSEIFAAVIKKLKPVVEIPKKALARTISISEKIRQIRESIIMQINTNFRELVKTAKSKTEVVVSFLALLELIKQRVVEVEQKAAFQDISISVKDGQEP